MAVATTAKAAKAASDEAVEGAPPAHAAPDVEEGDICPACWPNGWPTPSGTAGCEHGDWSYDVAAQE